jgi:uncharacterized protein
MAMAASAFADMSHRGSIECLPSGIYGWEPADPDNLSAADFERVFAEAADIEVLLVGTGTRPETPAWGPARAIARRRRQGRLDVDRRGAAHL